MSVGGTVRRGKCARGKVSRGNVLHPTQGGSLGVQGSNHPSKGDKNFRTKNIARTKTRRL